MPISGPRSATCRHGSGRPDVTGKTQEMRKPKNQILMVHQWFIYWIYDPCLTASSTTSLKSYGSKNPEDSYLDTPKYGPKQLTTQKGRNPEAFLGHVDHPCPVALKKISRSLRILLQKRCDLNQMGHGPRSKNRSWAPRFCQETGYGSIFLPRTTHVWWFEFMV